MPDEVKNTQEEQDEVKGFDDLFAEAVASDQSDNDDTDHDNNDDTDDDAADSGSEDVSADDGGMDGGDPAPAQQDSQQGADQTDYKALYEQELQRTRSWDGRLSAKDREIRTLQAELERTKQPPNSGDAADDGEEDESVKAFLEEFPELAAPIQKMIEKVAKKHGRSVADEITSKVESRLAPIAETVGDTVVQKHLNTIRAVHEDFEQIVQGEDLLKWINEQPRYMRPALMEVYERGYAEDVVDLISNYKAAKNIATPSSGPTSRVTQQNQSNPAKRPPAAVKSRHSAPPTRTEKIAEDDFDGAWAAALRTK